MSDVLHTRPTDLLGGIRSSFGGKVLSREPKTPEQIYEGALLAGQFILAGILSRGPEPEVKAFKIASEIVRVLPEAGFVGISLHTSLSALKQKGSWADYEQNGLLIRDKLLELGIAEDCISDPSNPRTRTALRKPSHSDLAQAIAHQSKEGSRIGKAFGFHVAIVGREAGRGHMTGKAELFMGQGRGAFNSPWRTIY